MPAAVGHPTMSPTAIGASSLACRLPVAGFLPPSPKGTPDSSVNADGQSNQKGTGGFLNMPAGSFTPVVGSDTSYLASAGVWLPVQFQAVSPDQRSYVQARAPRSSPTPPTTKLYLVDVGSRSERLLFTAPEGDMAYVLAYVTAGVYVETTPSSGGGKSNLELIDPATGTHRPVPGAEPKNETALAWLNVTQDTAWGMFMTNAQPPTFKLMKLGLADGSLTAWYDSPSPFLMVGVDSRSRPILGALNGAAITKLQVLSGPKQAANLPVDGGNFLPGQGTPVSDQHGIWVGSGDGSIWLYTPQGTFKKVATVTPQPGGNGLPYDPHAWRSVAGPCV
ncbi:MAG: hypothetical protein M3082_04425 [Candidatus Dormibacteraeota bacterium]|nr:hypothetical protein [Candidatus Dormibacteraeota bacterium]